MNMTFLPKNLNKSTCEVKEEDSEAPRREGKWWLMHNDGEQALQMYVGNLEDKQDRNNIYILGNK